MKYIKRMFGIDLTTLVKAQNTLIPAVVELCIKEIESRGWHLCLTGHMMVKRKVQSGFVFLTLLFSNGVLQLKDLKVS